MHCVKTCARWANHNMNGCICDVLYTYVYVDVVMFACRIYGDKAADIIDGLRKNPVVAVPLVLRRSAH